MYTLKSNPDQTKTLLKEGRPCCCPFQPAQMIQVQTDQRTISGERKSQMVKVQGDCGDQCPLFNIFDQDAAVALHCGGSERVIKFTATIAEA